MQEQAAQPPCLALILCSNLCSDCNGCQNKPLQSDQGLEWLCRGDDEIRRAISYQIRPAQCPARDDALLLVLHISPQNFSSLEDNHQQQDFCFLSPHLVLL